MQENKVASANNVPSFLIECLVWNSPNESFNHDSYSEDVRQVLDHIFDNTLDENKCSEWGEVNELKYLFRTSQPWTCIQAHNFSSSAWDHIGFE